MDSSPFIKLPRELRDIIYILVLSPGDVSIRIRREWRRNDYATPPLYDLGLLCTCRQMRTEVLEALPAYYANNTFIFTSNKVDGVRPVVPLKYAVRNFEELWSLNRWLDRIGMANFRRIYAIKFELYNWDILLSRSTDQGENANAVPKYLRLDTLGSFIQVFEGTGTRTTAAITAYHPTGETISITFNLNDDKEALLEVVRKARRQSLPRRRPSYFVLSWDESVRDFVRMVAEERILEVPE